MDREPKLHQFANLLPNWTFITDFDLLPNFGILLTLEKSYAYILHPMH